MNLSQELIKYLKQQFPDKSPDLNDKDREIWFKSGQASVVKHLAQLFEDQNKNILNNKTIKRSVD